MNHREQFSLSVMSETVFNFRALCCPPGIPSAKSGEFEQHDSLRLKQLLVYSRVTRDNSIVTLERWAAQCAYCMTMSLFASAAGEVHVGKNDLNDVYVVTQRQIPIDQIVQETTEIPQSQYIDGLINDSGVRAPQVLIVENTVENSQLR